MKVTLIVDDGQKTETIELTREALAIIADGATDKARSLESRIAETARTPEAKRSFNIEGLQRLQTELRSFSQKTGGLLISGK